MFLILSKLISENGRWMANARDQTARHIRRAAGARAARLRSRGRAGNYSVSKSIENIIFIFGIILSSASIAHLYMYV